MQAPNWTDFLQCAVCCSKFDAREVLPISLSCSHTLCFRCLGKLKSRVCPYDKSAISPDVETLPPNTALLQLLGERLETPPNLSSLKLSDTDLPLYRGSIEAIEGLAMFLQPLAEQGITVAIGYLTKPVLKKLVTVVNCQILEREGRARAMRAARSIADRTITELLVMHQNQQQIASLLWTAVRTRGCQFLGPVMQEAALKLIVKVLENGNSLARKNIVMFVVQRLQDEFPMASKTSVGHVVQLLYRASCFNVEKREEDSSLMQLKEEFRTYETLRREHDSQIIKMAMDTGLRISPEQWSTLLYGDHKHKSDMQSIIDKLISLGAASSGLSELIVAINRSQDPYKLSDKLIPHLEVLLKVDVNIDKGSELVGSWQMFSDTMTGLLATLNGFSMFMQIQSGRYRTGMCPHLSKPGGCPKGDHCTYAHTEEQRDHYRDLAKNSKSAKARTEPFPGKVSTGVRMGRFSGDHGPPKIDGSFYAGPGGYDAYPTVPPGYAPTAAAAAAAAAAAGGASVVTGLREPYAATQGFQGDSVVLQTAIPVDPTLQVLQATPTPAGGIYTTPVGATVVNYNSVPVGPTLSAPPHQPAQDWYKEHKLTSAYVQPGSDGSYLPKQNGHPPQQQYAGYHGNTSLPTYPERIAPTDSRPLDIETLRRLHESVKQAYTTPAPRSTHPMGGVTDYSAPSQTPVYEGQSAVGGGQSYNQPVASSSSASKFSYPATSASYPTGTTYSDDSWAYSADTPQAPRTQNSGDLAGTSSSHSDSTYYRESSSSSDPAYYHAPATSDSTYYHAPSSFEDYPFATSASDIVPPSSKNAASSVSLPEERRSSRHSFTDYSEDISSQMSKLDVGGASGSGNGGYKGYQSSEVGDFGSTSLAQSIAQSMSAVSSEGKFLAPPQTTSQYDVTSASSSWYEGTSSSSHYDVTSGPLYEVTSSLHHSGYGSISSTPSSTGTVTSGSGYPVVPTAISVTEQQLRDRVRHLEQMVKQKDVTIEEQRSQLKYSGPQKLYRDPTMISPGPASLYSSGSLPSPHHSGLIQHAAAAAFGTPPSISPQATMQHVQYYSHTAVPGGNATAVGVGAAGAGGAAFYTPPGLPSHRWSGPLNPSIVGGGGGGQYPSPPGSLPAQQTITPPGTHLLLHHSSGPILMQTAPATPTPPPPRQDLVGDQSLAAYLQVMEQNKAAAVASATPYAGSHAYHHHGYAASIHPGHTPQQAYYAPRQYHHKNTY